MKSPLPMAIAMTTVALMHVSASGADRLNPSWSPEGDLIAYSSKVGAHYQLFVVSADGGEPRRITATPTDLGEPGWTPDAAHLIATSRGERLVVVDLKSGEIVRTVVALPGKQNSPCMSPDGASVLFEHKAPDERAELVLVDLESGNLTPLTDDPANDVGATWTDEHHIAFHSNRTGSYQIHLLDRRSGEVTQLTSSEGNCWAPSYSPARDVLIYVSDARGAPELMTMNLDTGASSPVPLDLKGDMLAVSWSPDGTRFALNLDAGSGWEIYVVEVDGWDARLLVSGDD